MLSVFGRPRGGQGDTQSSEHGVAMVEHGSSLSGFCVKRNVRFLCDPDAMQEHS